MKLHTKITVEPLDEERVTNIERRIVIGTSERAPQPMSYRGFAYAGGVLAMAAAALVGWKLHTAPPVQPTAPVAQHFAVASSKISIDGATLEGTASYEVTRLPERIDLQLQRGTLELAVVHDPHRALVIHAGDSEIEDIGTKFRVDFDGASAIAVRVTEGEVQVRRRAQITRVSAGNAWTSDRGLVALAVLDAPNVIAAIEPPGAPAVRPHPAMPRIDRHAPVSPGATAPALPARDATEAPRAAIDPYIELRTAIRSVPLEFAPSIDGHADAATEIAKLKKIAYSPTTLGPEASAATYQIAVLLYRPLGQETEALNTLEIYRRRFAGGKEMHAAQWLRVRIQCSHAVDEPCRRAAYSYQHEVASGLASDVAVRITNAQ